MAAFPTFALLMAAEAAPRPCSELRQKQLAAAAAAHALFGSTIVHGEHDDKSAAERYIEVVSPMLPYATTDSTAAARALTAVLDFAAGNRHHLPYALASLKCAMDRAIRSQPEPTIAA